MQEFSQRQSYGFVKNITQIVKTEEIDTGKSEDYGLVGEKPVGICCNKQKQTLISVDFKNMSEV